MLPNLCPLYSPQKTPSGRVRDVRRGSSRGLRNSGDTLSLPPAPRRVARRKVLIYFSDSSKALGVLFPARRVHAFAANVFGRRKCRLHPLAHLCARLHQKNPPSGGRGLRRRGLHRSSPESARPREPAPLKHQKRRQGLHPVPVRGALMLPKVYPDYLVTLVGVGMRRGGRGRAAFRRGGGGGRRPRRLRCAASAVVDGPAGGGGGGGVVGEPGLLQEEGVRELGGVFYLVARGVVAANAHNGDQLVGRRLFFEETFESACIGRMRGWKNENTAVYTYSIFLWRARCGWRSAFDEMLCAWKCSDRTLRFSLYVVQSPLVYRQRCVTPAKMSDTEAPVSCFRFVH